MCNLCHCLSLAAFLCSRSRITEVASPAAELLHYESDHAHQGKEAGVLRVGFGEPRGSGCYSWQQQQQRFSACPCHSDSITARILPPLSPQRRKRPGALPFGKGETEWDCLEKKGNEAVHEDAVTLLISKAAWAVFGTKALTRVKKEKYSVKKRSGIPLVILSLWALMRQILLQLQSNACETSGCCYT